jgi:NADH dehydrogenase
MTFVVVGGGPTGVELAGALADISRHTLARNFRNLDPRSSRIVLLEGGPRLLPAYPPKLSERAQRQLQRLGVEVRLGAFVEGIDDRSVRFGDQQLPTRTVLWAAGLRAASLVEELGACSDDQGRVMVTPQLTLPADDRVFVIGDAAALRQPDGAWVPAQAPAAIQMGRYAARSILRREAGKTAEPFRYRDRGMLATVGRSRAVGVIGRLTLSGLLAWVVWLVVHLLYLIGFRNRIAVVMGWFWAYVTFHRRARVVIGTPEGDRWIEQRTSSARSPPG